MTTSPINTPSSSNKISSDKFKLKTDDFIKMMVTQLQNQDPTDPVKNQDLLAQMSQIGQLQSSEDLQTSLKGLVLQNSLGAAGNLIGKMVQGLDTDGSQMGGLVTSVKVVDNNVSLELDNGQTLDLSRVTSISQPTASTTGTASSSSK
jgi:flagellar basal-body rod modification protein FlgD